MTRKQAEEAAAWEKIMALPEDKWRGMIVKHHMSDHERIRAMEERRRRSDLPRLLRAEKKLEALEALTRSQASQIAQLQVMLSNAIAALLATPQGAPAVSELQCLTSDEVGEMLEHFVRYL